MRKINYTGASKVIIRLCEILNSVIDALGGKADVADIPTNTSDLVNDGEDGTNAFITATVNNLANYYLKSETYTQAEVDALIAAIAGMHFEVVQVLPVQDIQTNVIYLVPSSDPHVQNVYDEYIYVNNAWELIGSTAIDLTNYVTFTDLNTVLADYVLTSDLTTLIAGYYTKTETDTLLANKVDKIAGKGLSTEDYTTAEKTKLAGIETGAQVNTVTSVNGQTGVVVLDAADVGALPDDTPLLEPLIGTTLTLTPTQVSTAIQAGRPVVVTYMDSTYGTIIFDSFAISSGALVGSQTACIHSGSDSQSIVFVLSADITNNTWEFHPPVVLARKTDIPTKVSDLANDSGFSSVSANPASTTGTLTGIEIDGVSYAVSGGGSADLTDAWRVKGGTALTASQESPIDLNTYLTSGTYYMNTDAQVEFVANKPALAQDKRFTLIVQRVGNSGATIKQIFIGGYDNKVFWRFTRNTGSAWFAWEEMAYADKMWRLASGVQLSPTTDNHVDLDTLDSAGTYFITSDIADRVDNKPTTSTNRFTLIVQAIGNADEVRIKQIYMPRGTQANYIRYRDGSGVAWSAWKETAFVEQIPTKLSDLTDDVVSGNYVKTSNTTSQTIAATSVNNPIGLKTGSGGTKTYISYLANNGTEWGRIGVNSSGVPILTKDGGTTDLRIFTNADGYTWQLANGIAITATEEAHADLNTYTSIGTYYMSSNTAGNVDNKPVSNNYRFTLVVQRLGNNSTNIRQIFMQASNDNVYIRISNNSGSSWGAWYYIALSKHLDSYVKLSGAIQTIANTSTSQYAVMFLKSNATNGRSVVGFKDANDTTLGYLGVNENKKPIFLSGASGSSDQELALVANTLPSQRLGMSFAANTVGWHKLFLVDTGSAHTAIFLITWTSRYSSGVPSCGSALLVMGRSKRKLVPLSGYLDTQITKIRISGSNLSSTQCQIDAYYATNGANNQYFKITALTDQYNMTVLDGSLDTSTSTQEISASDEVLTNLTGVYPNDGAGKKVFVGYATTDSNKRIQISGFAEAGKPSYFYAMAKYLNTPYPCSMWYDGNTGDTYIYCSAPAGTTVNYLIIVG